mgnify:CR=1 FL=1
MVAALMCLLGMPRASISVQLVCLEALGMHGIDPPHMRTAVAALASSLSSATSDGGARAVAARALSQLSAQVLQRAEIAVAGIVSADAGEADPAGGEADPARLCVARDAVDDLSRPVGTLVAALSDSDRYVRAHAFEAICSLVISDDLLGGRCIATVGMAALGDATSPDLVQEALALARARPRDAQRAVRWLSCRRRCPLTSPESPF